MNFLSFSTTLYVNYYYPQVLSTVLADHLLHRLVESLLTQTQTNSVNSSALLRTLCSVSGAVGHRLGQAQIDRMVPLFLEYCQPEMAFHDNNNNDDDDDDGNENMMHDEAHEALQNQLRESCFMGFEAFVKRCPPPVVEPHMRNILQAALAYMCYDPNYSYDEDDDDEVMGEAGQTDTEDEFEDDDEDEMEYDDEEDEDDEEDDDDDESWKVRRSAIRVLKAICYAQSSKVLWTTEFPVREGQSSTVAAALLARFKEREENCRVELMECFTHLLEKRVSSLENDAELPQLPSLQIVKACEKILNMKRHERSKSTALAVLTALCKAPGGMGGADALKSVFGHTQRFLEAADEEQHKQHHQPSKTLRLDALTLVHAMLASSEHEPAHLSAALGETQLLTQLCSAVQEKWYKVIAQALRALEQIPRLADDAATATALYSAIEPLLATHDVDQEIKECALNASAALQTHLHSQLSQAQKYRLWELLLQRLRHETTRIPAMKTLASITPRPAEVIAKAVPVMARFLPCSSRTLQLAALETLNVVLLEQECPDPAVVLHDLAPLLGKTDTHMRRLIL